MNLLLKMIVPTIKSIISVIVFMIGLGWGAYQAVSHIAKAEAGLVRNEIKTIRTLDMEHLNKRFDTLEELVKHRR